MIEAIQDLPSHQIKRIIKALESGLLARPYTVSSVRSVLGLRLGGEEIVATLIKLDRIGVSGIAAAEWVRSIDAVISRTPRPDLVWTGPEYIQEKKQTQKKKTEGK